MKLGLYASVHLFYFFFFNSGKYFQPESKIGQQSYIQDTELKVLGKRDNNINKEIDHLILHR